MTGDRGKWRDSKRIIPATMKPVLNAIVDAIEDLAVSLDALEAALISRGQLSVGEIGAHSPVPTEVVRQKLYPLRKAISVLTVQ